ncbi:MAG: hypothetical protein RBU30_10150 [Polyangia bacterium]|jgi:hypothetical protein|nr:hypothetical protein [Polyangia bacterium]
MRLLAILLAAFGLWATSWGLFACYRRPAPHDLLGMAIASLGVGALGLAATLFIHPEFLG